MYPVAIYVE
jgi:hypothetical protein